MKYFALLVLVFLISLISTEDLRFETRPQYKKPHNHFDVTETSYSVPERRTQYHEKTSTVFHIIKTKEAHVGGKDNRQDLMTGMIHEVVPPQCCGFISSGSRIDGTLDFVIDPTNPDGLTDSFILQNFQNAVDQWEAVLPEDANPVGTVTLGNVPFNVDVNNPDGINSVFWTDIGNNGIIAFAATHGRFTGDDQEIFEVDIVYNTLGLGSADSNPFVYDFLTVTLHELGHGLGIGHTPVVNDCVSAVMFPSLSLGQTKPLLTSDDAQCGLSRYSLSQVLEDVGFGTVLKIGLLSFAMTLFLF